MLQLTLHSKLVLNTGNVIPVLGLGVWQIPQGFKTEQAVTWALEAGYRHFDTAKLYLNEASMGKAIRESKIPREEIFVTTKLWTTDAFNVDIAFETSAKKIGLEYIDLYLIHWPIPLLSSHTWKKLESLLEQKLVRSIGVCNYTLTQLDELLKDCNTPPAVNQIEFNPFNYEKELLDYCQQKGIVVEAYSPLTRGIHLDNENITKIAMQHKKTPAQIMLRWALQKGVVVIPKSSNKDRIIENADVFDFELPLDEMRRIDAVSHF